VEAAAEAHTSVGAAVLARATATPGKGERNKQVENRPVKDRSGRRRTISLDQVTRTCPPHVAEISIPALNPKEKTT
jgi:hypothetical protein